MGQLRGLLGALTVVGAGWALHACMADARRDPQPARWWRGNTHTHTLWSDGDGAPEAVAGWYRDAGYDFLVLSDHNLQLEGEVWFPVAPDSRLTPERLDELIALQPAGAVDWREDSAGLAMRLQTLAELRARFEAPGEFLFVQGEEVTSDFEGIPVHVNALNTRETLGAQQAGSVRALLRASLAAVAEQGRRLGLPTLAHLNHPNFGWGLTWEDLAAVAEERFFEVYNGHPGVANGGDDEHPSTERMWDLALARRLAELDLGLLYGVASDDSHHYHQHGPAFCNSGRGWIQVRARELSAPALIEAMQRGDFYASSGVTVADVSADSQRYLVRVDVRPGEQVTTRFLGARALPGGELEVGVLLLDTDANPAVYPFAGDELYVRAEVLSDLPHARPQREGERQKAWLQPVLGPAAP